MSKYFNSRRAREFIEFYKKDKEEFDKKERERVTKEKKKQIITHDIETIDTLYNLQQIFASVKNSTIIPKEWQPKHLYIFSETGPKGVVSAEIYGIRPAKNRSYGWRNYSSPWHDWDEIPADRNILNTIFEHSGKTASFILQDLGEGMAAKNEIILSNGDTPEFTRIDFEVWTEKGKILKSFFDIAIAKEARIFDFKRKCWFIKTDVVQPFLGAVQKLIDSSTLKDYFITDKREVIESFEEFFNNQGIAQSEIKKTKPELYREFEHILKNQAHVLVSIREDCQVSDLKKYYRQAALILHPDRNNGNGKMMADLNVVWSQIQQLGA